MMKRRILLADDSPVILSLTRKILDAQGFDVDTVKLGQSVVEQQHAFPYDLLVLDIFLPDINGLEVARKLRSAGVTVPIIGISGNAEDYSDTDLKEAGMNNFLLKPINYDELLTSIKALLES